MNANVAPCALACQPVHKFIILNATVVFHSLLSGKEDPNWWQDLIMEVLYCPFFGLDMMAELAALESASCAHWLTVMAGTLEYRSDISNDINNTGAFPR